MSEKSLQERYREHAAKTPRISLTAAEQDELKRRGENHSADKEIMALRAELKGIDLSITLLKEHRARRADHIRELQEGKRKAARGGA